MVAAEQPAGRPGLEPRVADHVGAGRPDHLHVVHQAFAVVEQTQVQAVDRPASVVHPPRPLNLSPRRLLRLVGVRPVRRQRRVRVWVLQLQAGAAAIRPLAPRAAVVVSHLAHRDVDDVGGHDSLAVRALDGVGLGEPYHVAAVPQRSLIATHHPRGGHVRMVRTQLCRVFRHHQELARGDPRPRREVECNPAAHPPTRQVHRLRPAVRQLHELVGITRGRVVEDLVDDHLLGASRRIRHAQGGLRQPTPCLGSVRGTPEGHAVLLRPELQDVDHPSALGRQQVHRLARRREPEPQRRLVPCLLRAGGQHGPRRDAKAVRAQVVRQDAPRHVHGRRRPVVEFHEVELRQVRVGQHLVQDNGVQGRRFHRLRSARRSSPSPAGSPGPGVLLPEAWRCQHQRMARPVGRNRPWCIRRVVQLQLHRPDRVPQPQGVAGVVQVAGPRSQDRRKAGRGGQRLRLRRHHHARPRLQLEPVREPERHPPVQRPPRHVHEHVAVVRDLDELHAIPRTRAPARRVLNLAEHQPGPARRRRRPLPGVFPVHLVRLGGIPQPRKECSRAGPGALAGRDQPQLRLRARIEEDGCHPGPPATVHARVGGHQRPLAPHPQPCRGRGRGEAAEARSPRGGSPGRCPRLREATGHRAGRIDGGKRRGGVRGAPQHQPGANERVRHQQVLHAHLHVEVVGAHHPCEDRLVRVGRQDAPAPAPQLPCIGSPAHHGILRASPQRGGQLHGHGELPMKAGKQ